MGVRGLRTLLERDGWLPPTTTVKPCNATPLLRRETCHETSPDIQDRIEIIPPGSTLSIDGNGLAFHLHRIAHSKYFQTVTGGGPPGPSFSCGCPKLKEEDVTLSLPHVLPLAVLKSVVFEFVDTLQSRGMRLVVYWDGPRQRFKNKTLTRRREKREMEWMRLQQYCSLGVVNCQKRNELCQRDFTANFPFSRLYSDEIRHAFQSRGVAMVYCWGEADPEVAKSSALDRSGRTYCVGNDSDYCLFGNVRYLPLDTLDVCGSVTSGIVIRREELAGHYGLNDELMVEMAILMGNDFIHGHSHLDYTGSSTADEVLSYLCEMGEGYTVTTTDGETQMILDFIRSFYGFRDLSQFPLDPEPPRIAIAGTKPSLPASLNLTLAALRPLDLSLVHVVLRPLTDYLQQGIENPMILQEHLDAFEQVASRGSACFQNEALNVSRLQWEDVVAAYIIEKCISWVYSNFSDSHVVQLTPPSELFHHNAFHSILRSYRQTGYEVAGVGVEVEVEVEEEVEVERTQLPIDAFEDTIIESIENQRVTIIHGETGCGKSSRVPVMCIRAPPPDPSLSEVKIFISQPRRIAAKSVMERVRFCEPDLSDVVALRMGHGVREYETSKTRLWFVTTGYLVRLMANHPESFNDCSHIIIDEVHERSVDTDILCLLCKRLLEYNPSIRLVLMSATMAGDLYRDYFRTKPPIHVGARRFPIREYFVEDIAKSGYCPPKIAKAAKDFSKNCETTRCKAPPSSTQMKALYEIAAHITSSVGRAGSSILIFVPGMSDIVSISELIEKIYVPGVRFTFLPIHGDIPFEEQMTAFDPPAADQVKVVIATNAAESSITLPNVDHVICLGLCKQIVYNESSHRQMLTSCWISRASATQRAGRTGRVREGNVYRLYSRNTFHKYMDTFDSGEMVRIPLDNVILSLKEMLKEEVTPILDQCIQPPDLSTINRSFKSLHDSHFLTEPDDTGDMTNLGSFVATLGIDLTLGSLIGLGIQFGVAAEAIEMAAILSFPKSPWQITNALIHDPKEFNDITRRTFVSRCHFDANLYSEPMSIMNLMWDYEHTPNTNGWFMHYSVSGQRLKQTIVTRNSLRKRVAQFAKIDEKLLKINKPPSHMAHAKVTILRIIQVWVFSDSIIECDPGSFKSGSLSVALNGPHIQREHLEQVLDPVRHPFSFDSVKDIEQFGTFSMVEERMSLRDFVPDFENRFLSYALENQFDVVWYTTKEAVCFYAPLEFANSPRGDLMRRQIFKGWSEVLMVGERGDSVNKRGRKGRACGLWSIRYGKPNRGGGDNANRKTVQLKKWSACDKRTAETALKKLRNLIPSIPEVKNSLCCSIAKWSQKKTGMKFSLVSRGESGVTASKTELCDIFGTPIVTGKTRELGKSQQKINLEHVPNRPLPPFSRGGKGMNGRSMGVANIEGNPLEENEDGTSEVDDEEGAIMSTADLSKDCSWHRPLMEDIPEGVKLLSVLASSRWKEHCIKFSPLQKEKVEGAEEEEEEDEEHPPTLDVSLPKDQTKISQRWLRFNTDKCVYVAENSVPVTAVPFQTQSVMFACPANTLELRGGSIRVEGLTLLPPGRLFLLLSLLCYGVSPISDNSHFEDENFAVDDKFRRRCLQWLGPDVDNECLDEGGDFHLTIRLHLAKMLHDDCKGLGANLECFPQKVRALCKLFDKVDGYKVEPWDDLDDNVFTSKHMRPSSRRRDAPVRDYQNRSENYVSRTRNSVHSNPDEEKKSDQPMTPRFAPANPDATDLPLPPKSFRVKNTEQRKKNGVTSSSRKLTDFSKKEYTKYASLFHLKQKKGVMVGKKDLPSTNILSHLCSSYCNATFRKKLNAKEFQRMKARKRVCYNKKNWKIFIFTDTDGKEWFLATFTNQTIPEMSLDGRDFSPSSQWIADGLHQPKSIKDAKECIPPHLAESLGQHTNTFWSSKTNQVLAFDTLTMALQMEASFWLERQLGDGFLRWYQQPMDEMLDRVLSTLDN